MSVIGDLLSAGLKSATGFVTTFKVTLIAIAVTALVVGGAAVFTTANYYNNKIITASTTAAGAAAADAQKKQKAADKKVYDAMEADYKSRLARQHKDDTESTAADSFLAGYNAKHPEQNSHACDTPPEVSRAINGVLQ
jgi:hypothetical protein